MFWFSLRQRRHSSVMLCNYLFFSVILASVNLEVILQTSSHTIRISFSLDFLELQCTVGWLFYRKTKSD